jgi:hypothetical protein
MPHLLPILFPVVRKHVADEQAPSGHQNSRGLLQRGTRVRHVMEHEQERRCVERVVVERQRLELAAADVDVGEVPEPSSCRLQHLS